MGNMKRRLAWWLRGHGYVVAIEQHTEAIGLLQTQVAELTSAVDRLDRVGATGEELNAVVDDLTARLAAMSDRIDAIGR